MSPSNVPTPNTPAEPTIQLSTRAVPSVGRALEPRLRQHPPELPPADVVSPPARPLHWPNRVHFRLGPFFCLGYLPTSHRCDAVFLGYPSRACLQMDSDFHWLVSWFHQRTEGCGPSQPPVRRNQHHFTAPTEQTPSSESQTILLDASV